MKTRDLKKLALMGLLGGLIVANHATLEGADLPKDKTDTKTDPNAGNMNWHLMTEKELLLQLNEEGIAQYNSLTPEGKQLAREVASAMCNGTNKCKGLGACATDKHTCAGKNDCEAQGKCAIADKNLAVDLVAKKMAQKRANAK